MNRTATRRQQRQRDSDFSPSEDLRRNIYIVHEFGNTSQRITPTPALAFYGLLSRNSKFLDVSHKSALVI